MSTIVLKELSYKNYGRCLSISNGEAELIVTLDVGPRIICYRLSAGENVFFEDTERSICNKSEGIKKVFGPDAVWYIYGGHRLWASPEYDTTYNPDNGPVEYKATENGARFSAGVQSVLKLRFEMEVRLDDAGSGARIIHRIQNGSEKPVELAPWALSVLAPGGVEVIPLNTEDTGYLPNRVITLWPYTRLTDPRFCMMDKYITVSSVKGAPDKFKLGFDLRKGCVAYINKGTLFVKRFIHKDGAQYPDGGCSFETYTDANFLECETLGPLVKLEKGETAEHEERWSLKAGVSLPDGGEKALDAFAKEHILSR